MVLFTTREVMERFRYRSERSLANLIKRKILAPGRIHLRRRVFTSDEIVAAELKLERLGRTPRTTALERYATRNRQRNQDAALIRLAGLVADRLGCTALAEVLARFGTSRLADVPRRDRHDLHQALALVLKTDPSVNPDR
jgi:hypothetical protein